MDRRLRLGVSGNESVCSTIGFHSSWAAEAGASSRSGGKSKSPAMSSKIKAGGAAAVAGGTGGPAACSRGGGLCSQAARCPLHGWPHTQEPL